MLHHIIMSVAFLADSKYRHDVGMMQPSGGSSLASKPFNLPGVFKGPRGQNLERDTASQRLLLGLVDDAHAAAADFSDNAILTQVTGRLVNFRLPEVADGRSRDWTDVFEHHEARETGP